MVSDILQVAYREYSSCMKELKASDAFQKLKAYEKVILLHGGTLPSSADKWMQVHIEKLRAGVSQGRDRTGKMGRVWALSAECISQNGGYAHRKMIHTYLALKGTHLTLQRLSAYLSEASEFEPNRENGWRVHEWQAGARH